jgi:hypothetical protein
MSFLTPFFLAALVGLGVPVLIHMIQRQRTELLEFPSLMFVRKIPFHSMRRQRIRHWLLLLLRCAALALLVAAFARPFLRSNALASVTGGAREVVVLIDRSYSMGFGDRWDRARAAARGIVNDLAPDDLATVIFFDSGAQTESRSTNDQASLLAAINRAELGTATTRYGSALQLAEGVLEDSDQPVLEAVLISDFQQVGVDSVANIQLPAGTILTPVLVAGEETTENVSVVGVSVQRDRFSGRERAAVTARVANRGVQPVENLQVSLELNGYELESGRVAIEPSGVSSVTFAPFTLEDAAMPVTVRSADDALLPDNVFHFTVSPGNVMPVLLVGSPGAEDAGLYLQRALAIGTSPAFEVTTRSIDEVTVDDVDAAAVVVLNDVGLPEGPVGAALTAFVEAGGGLWIALGERVRWPGDNLELLPGPMDAPVDREGRGGGLGYIDYSHPVFEIFSSPRSGDLTTPRFFRYRPLTVGSETAVLARYDNGAAALAEHVVGDGRVLVWTSSIDSYWNDFALKATYLPFVHKIVAYLGEYREPMPYLTAGQVLDLAQYPAATTLDLTDGDLVVRNPSEDRAAVGTGGRDLSESSDPGMRSGFIDLDEQGFYEIRDLAIPESAPVTVAVNVDLTEANLDQVDPQELVAAATGRAAGDRDVGVGRELRSEDLERRQTLWWYFLIGALGFLATETVISNKLSRTELDPDD